MTNKEVVILDSSQEPVAEIVNKYGDPETFAEREMQINNAELQKLPIGTKLYALPPDAALRKENGALRTENAQLFFDLERLKIALRDASRSAKLMTTYDQHEIIAIEPHLWAALKGGAA